MAIKAIINNTEKEIEQIKNSNEQDVDYVYSRIGDTEVEGEPPISIKSIGGNLADYRIYGNTDDGKSVGNRTANLFDKTKFIQTNIVAQNDLVLADDPYTISTILPCNPNTKYTISKIVTNRFVIWGCTDYPRKDAYCNKRIISDNDSSSLTFKTGNDDNYLLIMLFYQRQPTDPTIEDVKGSLMFNYGNALPYEPYGYKVPMTVEGKNLYKISTFRDGSTSAVVSAVTFTINNNAVSISGISSAQHPSVTSQRFELISGETYSAKIFVDGSYDGEMYIIMRGGERQDGSDEVKYKRINVGSGDTFVAKTYNSIIYVAEGTNKEFNAIVRVILIKGSMLPDTYEPYHAPVTTPIYLPEQIRKVGDEAEYIDYGEQKMHRVRKNLFPVDATSKTINGITFTVNADKSVTCNGTNNGTTSIFEFNPSGVLLEIGESYIVTGCPEGGKIFGGYIIQYNNGASWSDEIGHGATFTVSGSGVVRLLILISRGVTVDNLTFYPMIRKADIEDDTYEPYIENTDLDVTLPALSTIKGTNTFLVNTLIPPSMYIKDNFDYKRIFTATRAIEDELPLNYKNIEDNDSILSNYRIYGQTVDGESVGDRTANLFDKNDPDILYGYEIQGTNIVIRQMYFITNFISVNAETSYITNDVNIGGFGAGVLEYDSSKQLIRRNPNRAFDGFTTTNTTAYIRLNSKIVNKDTCMLVKGNTAPSIYEPYGYKVSVTVNNGTDTLTAPIYLPEQIRKVGDEAEYIDYAEQKQHRVRKNLLLNTATSRTINGVTFTVNEDGSITCNGTATNITEAGVFLDFLLPPGNYRLTGCPPGGRSSYPGGKISYCLRAWCTILGDITWFFDYGDGCNFTLTDTKKMRSSIVIEKAQVVDNITFYPMIRKADIEDDTYEPYIENTDLDVTLPALPTLPGTNVLSVGTEVQPSEIYIKGKIKEIN